jgi:intein/homing endonuclease
LGTFVRKPFTSEAYFDFERFKEVIKIGVRFLDNVLDVTGFPLKVIAKTVPQERRIGLGFTGYADMLIMMNLTYGSDKALKLTHDIGIIKRNMEYRASIELATLKGSFPSLEREKFINSGFCKRLPEDIRKDIVTYGIRNMALSTVAPTGCLTSDTLISTSKGFLLLQEFGDLAKESSQWQDIKELGVNNTLNKTNIGSKDITRFFKNENSVIKEIVTSSGLEEKCTTKHQWKVWDDKENKEYWCYAFALKKGDLILSPYNYYKNSTDSILVKEYPAHKEPNIEEPTLMSMRLAWFTGLVDGVGSIKNNMIKLEFKEEISEETILSILNIVEWLFDISDIEINMNEENVSSLHIKSTLLPKWMVKNGLIVNNWIMNRVPFTIRTSSNESMRAYINGLLISNGVNHNEIVSLSKEFITNIIVMGRSVMCAFKYVYDKENELHKAVIMKKEDCKFINIDGISYLLDEVKEVKDYNSELLTYDLEVPETHEYIANGLLSHNTTSLSIGNNCSSGIEPVFSFKYDRTIRQGNENETKTETVYDEVIIDYYNHLKGSNPNLTIEKLLEEKLPEHFVSTYDIDYYKSIDTQAVWQKYIDNSISKCIVEGTLLKTNKGLIPIENIFSVEHPVAGTYCKPNDIYEILDEFGEKRLILSCYYDGFNDAMRITFSNGIEKEVGVNHKFKTINGWKRAIELKKKDRIYIRNEELTNKGQTTISLRKLPVLTSGKEIDVILDENIAKLFGILTNYSYITEEYIKIYILDNKKIDEVEALINHYFDYYTISNYTPLTDETIKSIDIVGKIKNDTSVNKVFTIPSIKVSRYLKTILGDNKIKKIPYFILTSNKNILSSYLEGLAIYENEKDLVYNGESKLIAFSLCDILDSFGMSYVVKKHKINKNVTNYQVRKKEFYFVTNLVYQKNGIIYSEENEINTVEVVKIENIGKRNLYDISVEDTHSYTISGIVVHNTLNLPAGVTFEEYKNIYLYAYDKGLKGFTTFRADGFLKGILQVENKDNKKDKETHIIRHSAPKRPDELKCDIHQMSIVDKDNIKRNFFVLIGLLEDSPYEVFVDDNTNGIFNVNNCKNGLIKKTGKGSYDLIILDNNIERFVIKNISTTFDQTYGILTRLISMSLRHGTPISFIVEQLQKSNTFTSFERVLARVLKDYIRDSESPEGEELCPECGSKLQYIEGCLTCSNKCGYSKCG